MARILADSMATSMNWQKCLIEDARRLGVSSEASLNRQVMDIFGAFGMKVGTCLVVGVSELGVHAEEHASPVALQFEVADFVPGALSTVWVHRLEPKLRLVFFQFPKSTRVCCRRDTR